MINYSDAISQLTNYMLFGIHKQIIFKQLIYHSVLQTLYQELIHNSAHRLRVTLRTATNKPELIQAANIL